VLNSENDPQFQSGDGIQYYTGFFGLRVLIT